MPLMTAKYQLKNNNGKLLAINIVFASVDDSPLLILMWASVALLTINGQKADFKKS